MPRNGSGTYLPPAGTAGINGATISEIAYNDYVNDNATAMSESINTSGTKPWTGNQSMGGFHLTSVGAGSSLADGANLQQTQERIVSWAQAGGTGDVITATYAPNLTAYTNGMTLSLRASAANTIAAPTANFNAVGARKIFKAAGSPLVAGDIAGAGHDLQLTYNSSLDSAAGGWLLHNPQSTQSLNITGQTALTAVAIDDELPIYDLSATTNKKITTLNLWGALNVFAADGSPDANADFLASFDTSAGLAKKVLHRNLKVQESFAFAIGDETSALTTGTGKLTYRMPYAFVLTAVRGSLTVVSSSGLVTVNIKEAGVTIFSTQLTFDQSEDTTTTAATPAVISDPNLADDAKITFDIVTAGTGAAGLKVTLIGYRA